LTKKSGSSWLHNITQKRILVILLLNHKIYLLDKRWNIVSKHWLAIFDHNDFQYFITMTCNISSQWLAIFHHNECKILTFTIKFIINWNIIYLLPFWWFINITTAWLYLLLKCWKVKKNHFWKLFIWSQVY
jgi:hypothetical protein